MIDFHSNASRKFCRYNKDVDITKMSKRIQDNLLLDIRFLVQNNSKCHTLEIISTNLYYIDEIDRIFIIVAHITYLCVTSLCIY